VRRRAGGRLAAAARFPTAAFLGSGLVSDRSATTLRRKASMRLMTLRGDGFVRVSLLGTAARFFSRNIETSAVLYRSSNHATSKSAVFVSIMCFPNRRVSSGSSSFGISAKYSASLRTSEHIEA
jgi:hypothetical protein